MSLQSYLDEEIKKVCPIYGMSFGNLNDKKTWVILFKESATDLQRLAAQDIIDSFIWDDATKEKSELRNKSAMLINDLLYRKFYKEYKDQKKDATFEDFIKSLQDIQV